MCPDSQIISVYLDKELPSPWKEKIEIHFEKCPECKQKLENLKRLSLFLKQDTDQELIETAAGRVWKNLVPTRRFRPNPAAIWQRKFSVPLPAAAAAAVVIALLTLLWVRTDRNVSSIASQPQEPAITNFFLAAEEDIPNIPVSDMNSVLQYLAAEGSNIIILQLPESKNFSRIGEPEILRAADYSTGR